MWCTKQILYNVVSKHVIRSHTALQSTLNYNFSTKRLNLNNLCSIKLFSSDEIDSPVKKKLNGSTASKRRRLISSSADESDGQGKTFIK